MTNLEVPNGRFSIRGKIRILQGIVILLCVLSIALFARILPIYYDKLISQCLYTVCKFGPAPPTTKEALSAVPITEGTYVFLFVLMDGLLTFAFYLAAAIIAWKGFKEPMGVLAVLMLVSFGTVFTSVVPVAGSGPSFALALGWGSFVLFFFLFPNGRFAPRWTQMAACGFLLVQAAGAAFPGSAVSMENWSFGFKAILLVVTLAMIVGSQIYRYRRFLRGSERQQTKWVVYGVACSMTGLLIMNVLYSQLVAKSPLVYVYLNAWTNLFIAIIPVTLTIAVLRHRLWDIDPLVNRTLVYAGLTLSIIGIYIVSVTYLGRVFQTEDNLAVSLAATTLVAILFAPLKERLHRLVNRLMYGRNDEPFSVLTDLSRQMEHPMSEKDVLDVVVRTIRESLRLPYASITFLHDYQDTVVASSGESTGENVDFPIIHRGKELAVLSVSLRSPGEALRQEDRQLLDVIIRQAGPIVQSVLLTAGLQRLAGDLQESREKLVLAREEERRRLRRNLHDDLAPRLAALALNVAAAERQVSKSPETTTKLLAELRTVIRSTVVDIRTLVHDLRPRSLDELGLIGAIRARIDELVTPPRHVEAIEETELQVCLEAPEELPPLPAAVEVAAYRIITEALVNTVRHARAANCTVRIVITENGRLRIEVADDGIGLAGFNKPRSANGGIGTQSMREQAAELGGYCLFEQGEKGGLRVIAVLPYETRMERKPYEDLARG